MGCVIPNNAIQKLCPVKLKGGQALYESTIDLTFLKDSQINYMPRATSQYHLFLFLPGAYSKDSSHPRPLKLGHH